MHLCDVEPTYTWHFLTCHFFVEMVLIATFFFFFLEKDACINQQKMKQKWEADKEAYTSTIFWPTSKLPKTKTSKKLIPKSPRAQLSILIYCKAILPDCLKRMLGLTNKGWNRNKKQAMVLIATFTEAVSCERIWWLLQNQNIAVYLVNNVRYMRW